MENQFDKKLFSAFKNRLKAHNEPYEAGAWESFLDGKKKRRRAVVFWYAAAVILLLLVSTFIRINVPFQTGGTPEKQQPTTYQIEGESLLITDSIESSLPYPPSGLFPEKQPRAHKKPTPGQQPAHLYSSSADSVVKIQEQTYAVKEPVSKKNPLDFNGNSIPATPQINKAPETTTNNPPAADGAGNGNNAPLTIAGNNQPSSVESERSLPHKEAQLPDTERNQTIIAEKDPSIIPEKDLSVIKREKRSGANEKVQPLVTGNNRLGADSTGLAPGTGQTPDLATAQPAEQTEQGPVTDSTQRQGNQNNLIAGGGYANEKDSVAREGIGLINEALKYENTKKRKAKQPLLALGFGLASGYGETEEAANGINGLIREAGVIANLKFSRRFTLASGLFFASQTIESEEDLPLELAGALSSTRSATTTLANLNMPINLKYTLPNRKENLFIAAGIANFVRFGAESETVRTTDREITVIRELNGIEMLTTEIETVTSQSTNEDNRTTFIPAGMINISAGLSNRLSDQLQLEVSPYYKYPLRDWPGQDARFGIIGLDLRLLFQKKKQP